MGEATTRKTDTFLTFLADWIPPTVWKELTR